MTFSNKKHTMVEVSGGLHSKAERGPYFEAESSSARVVHPSMPC